MTGVPAFDPDSPFLEVLLARSGQAAASPAAPPGPSVGLVADAVAALRRGAPVVLVDTRGTAGQGYLVQLPSALTPAALGFLAEVGTGLIGVALPAQRCAQLRLSPMTDQGHSAGLVYAVSVDAAGATSGGSLTDRRRTVEALADPTTAAADLRRPGHVFPVIARPGGVLDGGGPAEAALALAQLAGMPAAAVVCEVGSTTDRDTDPDGELAQLARRHRLVLLYLDDVLVHQRLHEDVVRVGAATRLPLPTGPFTAELLVSGVDSVEVLALRLGDLDDAGGPGPLVHVHVECLLGDALGSQRCPCAGRLAAGLAEIAADGSGLLLYLRDGGAAGIVDLLSVYAREDAAPDGGSPGSGHPAPRWDAVADALHVLGVRRVRLAGGDRAALTALGRLGIEVTAAQGPVGVGG